MSDIFDEFYGDDPEMMQFVKEADERKQAAKNGRPPLRVVDSEPPAEPSGFYNPPGLPSRRFDKEPPPDRSGIALQAWLKLDLPPRDFLMGELLSTVSRWLLIGETGVGKTLFALDLAAAVAAGADFIGWKGKRRARVLYFDGELPAETMKERLEIIAKRYGEDLDLHVYNRDMLGPDEMPPFDTEPGRASLFREIDTRKPDLVIFDAIMCLLIGKMSDEESWQPVKGLVREISKRRVAQVWLHHTGHNADHGFGTKTREWEMDAVALLSNASKDDEEAFAKFQLEFTKARHRNPDNFAQFKPKVISNAGDGFEYVEGRLKSAGGRGSDNDMLVNAFRDAYHRLADGVKETPGLDGDPVRKVLADKLRDDLKARGWIETDEAGSITSNARSRLRRAKQTLFIAHEMIEQDGLVWSIKTRPRARQNNGPHS